METVWIILGLWIVPGVLAFVLGCWHSKKWCIDGKDLILFLPLVNIVVFGLVLVILFDDLVINRIWD